MYFWFIEYKRLTTHGCKGNTHTNLSLFVFSCLFTDKQLPALLPWGWFVLTSNGVSNMYGRGIVPHRISSSNTSRYSSKATAEISVSESLPVEREAAIVKMSKGDCDVTLSRLLSEYPDPTHHNILQKLVLKFLYLNRYRLNKRGSHDQMSKGDCNVTPNRLLSARLQEFPLTLMIYGFRLIINPMVYPYTWKWQDNIMI